MSVFILLSNYSLSGTAGFRGEFDVAAR